MNYTSIPGPGDLCPGCDRALCRCRPEPELDRHWEASYEAGHDRCLADGYAARPGNEWVYLTDSRSTWDAHARRERHHARPLRIAELTWRHRHRTASAYARWFERHYGFDLDAYLVGFDEAGSGLPSAVADPGAHARAAAALDAYEPLPDDGPLPDGEPEAPAVHPWPLAVDTADVPF